ncbi:hypothetical protein [Microcoleus sp. Aus8_D4]|uniref:hypothetical protein n=1 Tax=Microcoleus sp. Aus8_D4 TaxID=2818634 RepID=UPI003FA5769E
MPLFLRAASGNESDNSVFASIFQDFKKQLNLDSLMVADSALYTAPNLEILTNLRWLTPVPLSLSPSAATGRSTCRNQNFMKVQ